MGLVVVGLGLGNLVFWFLLIDLFTRGDPSQGPIWCWSPPRC
jgi:hypothetical protein